MFDLAGMVLLRAIGYEFRTMIPCAPPLAQYYVTLEHYLMRSAVLSFVGIKRIVYASLAEDGNPEEMIVRGLTLLHDNNHFCRALSSLSRC
jgi:hypothetical protein